MTTTIKKEIGLSLFLLAYSTLLFWLLTSTLLPFSYLTTYIILAIIISLWVACLAITLMFVSNLTATLLIILIASLLVVLGQAQLVIVGVAIIILGVLSSARFYLHRNLERYIHYRTKPYFYTGVKILLMATIVILAGILAPHVIRGIETNTLTIPEEIVRLFIAPLEPIWQNNVPGYSADMTIDEMIDTQLQQQHFQGTQADVLAQKKIIQEQLGKSLNTKIAPQQDLVGVITSVLNKQIKTITQASPLITIIFFLSSIVLVARFFIPLFTMPILILIAALIYLAKKTKLITLTSVSQPVEHLEL